MTRDGIHLISRAYRQTHQRVLELAGRVGDEETFHARLGRSTSVAFNVWHLGRWADWLQSAIPEMTPEARERLGERDQIWQARHLAVGWGLDPERLGAAATGMGLADELSAELSLPDRDAVLEYVRSAFGALEEVLDSLDEGLAAREASLPLERTPWLSAPSTITVEAWALNYLIHANRHLGMMEALLGVHGLRGTATL